VRVRWVKMPAGRAAHEAQAVHRTGATTLDLCRRHGLSEQTFYRLEDENGRLKRLVGLRRSTCRSTSRRDPARALYERLHALAAQRQRFGYRQAHGAVATRRPARQRQTGLSALPSGGTGCEPAPAPALPPPRTCCSPGRSGCISSARTSPCRTPTSRASTAASTTLGDGHLTAPCVVTRCILCATAFMVAGARQAPAYR